MSDFLRNLRGSHKKEKSHPRRNLDGHYYPKSDRRRIADRRFTNSEGLDSLFSCLNDLLPRLVETTTQLADTLEQKQEDNGPLIEARIRQHNAISLFFDNLNSLFSEEPKSYPADKSVKATASYASGTHYTKDDILKIIREMRKDGTTYAIIADYLKDKGIPTFSGRGEWHAQTIHRLCK